MTSTKPRLYFVLIILSLSLVLSFLVFRPFLYSLILALVFAIIFQPLYKKILRFVWHQPWLAAILTILILVVFILVPLTFLAIQIFYEAQGLYSTLVDGLSNQTLNKLLPGFGQSLSNISPLVNDLSLDINQHLTSFLGFLVRNLGVIFSNLAKILTNLFVFLVAFFFLLKDGDRFKQRIIYLSPLSKDDDGLIIKKITQAINSVIKGSLLIAVLQGISSSLGFIIFGVPNPIMWGTLAAIGALVPSVGTAIVIVPAVIYLYLTGQLISALGLLAWGILAVGLIDNFLGPKFVSQGAGLHPLLILLSVLGGLSFFGPIGFILGPLVIAMLIVLLDIYASIIK